MFTYLQFKTWLEANGICDNTELSFGACQRADGLADLTIEWEGAAAHISDRQIYDEMLC